MRSFLAWFDAVDFFHLPIWAMAILRIAFIVFFWILITRLVSKALKTIVAHYCVEEIKGSERLKRIETIQRVVLYILRAALAFLAVSLVLNEIGISIVPILGAAGVAGIAIGLAAQNLLKDYLNGLFLLLENHLKKLS